MRKKSTKPKIPKSTGKERKAFAVKMLVDNPKPVWAGELLATKKIYELFPIDFLNKVKKPDFKINSCFYFLSENGKEYLTKKLKEFLYKPVKYDIIEGTEKVGDDWNGIKRRGLRDFIEGN
jgi:hypothetical protein